jgi:hypothetical protein
MITPYSNIISVTTLEVLLLDTYSGAAAAYSLRRLSGAYTGSAIRVRRASDNTELDIGFVSNELDTSALANFCSGTDGFVKTWYDQSGNGYDATQTTAANQPQIVSSGSVITENGKPSVQFDGSNDRLGFAEINLTQATSLVTLKRNATAAAQDVLDVQNPTQNYSSLNVTMNEISGYGRLLVFAGGASTGAVNGLGGASISIYRLYASIWNGLGINGASFYSIYDNGTLQSLTNSGALGISNGATSLIGAANGASGATRFFDGKIQEIILYPSDQSSNIVGLNTNINAQYQLYWDGSQTSLLDSYGGSAAAYSLRALSSAYVGPLVRVRRASDNAEQDIYANYDGTLNTSSLESFCSGTNGFVETWYDQSGNGNDATQSTAANQPQIVSSGSVLSVNSKPSISFDGTNDVLNLTLFTASNYSHFCVMTKISTGTTAISLGNAGGQSVGVAFENNWYESAGGTFLSGGYTNNTNQNLFSVIKSGNNVSDFVFTQNTTTLTGFSGSGFTSINIQSIGARPSGLFGTQKLQEIVFYDSIQTSNATGIKININDFYSIY